MAFRKLLDIITTAAPTKVANLRTCIDAGDIACVSASTDQTLITEAGASNFFRGSDATGTGTDPTFAGTPGGLTINDRYTLDGGDFFRITTTNPTWALNLHKDNAKFTILIAFKYKVTGAIQRLIGTVGTNTGSVGMTLLVSATGALSLIIGKGGSSTALVAPTQAMPVSDSYAIVAVTLDEAAGGTASFSFVNGTFSSGFDGTYTTPATVAANNTMELMSGGNAAAPVINGTEFFGLAVVEGAIFSQAELTTIYNELGQRLGLVPPPVTTTLAATALVAPAAFGYGTVGIDAQFPMAQVVEAQNTQGQGEIDLFEIRLVGGAIVYYKANENVAWQGHVYEGIAIQLTGVEDNVAASDSKPKLIVVNKLGVFSSFIAAGNLEKAIVIRRRVLRSHMLKNAKIFQQRTWFITQVSGLNNNQVTCELRALSDGPNFLVPARMFLSPEFPVVSLQ